MRILRRLFPPILLTAMAPSTLLAHGGETGPPPAAGGWTWHPVVAAMILASAFLYFRGWARLERRRSGGPVRASARELAAFAGGWVALVAALFSPVDSLSAVLFSVHMSQHEILMLVAAPLLVLARPLATMLWAFPRGGRRRIGDAVRTPFVARGWRRLTAPVPVFVLHAVALWTWHVPALYEAALRSDAIHALQHACFLFTASLFWWALVHGRYGKLGYGLAVLFVFATTLHANLLGALLTFSPALWYPLYAARGPLGADPLADQQLAGVIMWIPFGVLLVLLGLGLFAAWLGEAARRVRYTQAEGLWESSFQLPASSSQPEDASWDVEKARRLPADAAPLFLLALLVLACAGCRRTDREKAIALTGGDPDRGRASIRRYGCESCHTIPGVPGARGLVGPSLEKIGQRVYLAGYLPNTPENLMGWIQRPQRLHAPTAMPDMQVTGRDARDIAAYLYTLR